MVTARSLKHAQLDLGLQEQELQGGLSKLYIQNRKRSRCQWPLALCGYRDPITLGEASAQQETNPKELLFTGELFTWALLEAPWSVSHVEEQQSHVPTLPVSPGPHSTDLVLQLRHQKKLPLPSLDLPGPKADSFPPEGCFHFFPGKGAHQLQHRSTTSPCPGPSSSGSLSQAWLGMEMCSWDRNGAPEPAFGYQPWVWFEILPEENITTSSGRALLPQTLEEVTSHQHQPSSAL